ncbi:hypothetical protein DW228_06275 [Bacteroides fragilis]|uniref:Uncharacterized protein n=1 Tax=Bacteroides fragilis TaxID=817 RepID=A0A396C5P4_BACFG|nr:hypothetical protein [Bacteroides fragilis]RHH14403.1 hypothetical protein DW228_06275 [Bacteroides fragilis]
MLDNEFVILKCDGEFLRFTDKDIVVYGDREEADDDCCEGEYVTPLSELPAELLCEIIEQTERLRKE